MHNPLSAAAPERRSLQPVSRPQWKLALAIYLIFDVLVIENSPERSR